MDCFCYNLNMKNNLIWLSALIIITAIFGTIHFALQQDIRMSANDPQIEIAEDLASQLSSGQAPETLIPPGSESDILKTLSPHAIVFDNSGKPIVSSASLNSQIPVPPAGVFDWVRKHGEDRITWQPLKGVREAIVVLPYSSQRTSGFVLAGRSLREIEKREDKVLWETSAAWAFSVIILSLSALLIRKKRS